MFMQLILMSSCFWRVSVFGTTVMAVRHLTTYDDGKSPLAFITLWIFLFHKNNTFNRYFPIKMKMMYNFTSRFVQKVIQRRTCMKSFCAKFNNFSWNNRFDLWPLDSKILYLPLFLIFRFLIPVYIHNIDFENEEKNSFAICLRLASFFA